MKRHGKRLIFSSLGAVCAFALCVAEVMPHQAGASEIVGYVQVAEAQTGADSADDTQTSTDTQSTDGTSGEQTSQDAQSTDITPEDQTFAEEQSEGEGGAADGDDDAAAEPAETEDETSWIKGVKVDSKSAILVEASTGTVLYEKKADEKRYPASITKIMTAMLILEYGNLDDIVTFSEDSIYQTEGSGIARDVGEQMTLEQCLYALMLESANECAYAAAEHVGEACGGGYDTFIDMMNEKAEELGCTNTHFSNSHGLPDDDHYTSCRDMALIAQEACKNSEFMEIIGTETYTIPPTNKHDEEYILYNHHSMITAHKTNRYLYDCCLGGKTGYTIAAGNTLLTFAKHDGMTLICVVMKNDEGTHYTDTRSLFDAGFENFSLYNVAENETRYDGIGESVAETADPDSFLTEGEAYARIDEEANIVLPTGASFSDTVVTVEPADIGDGSAADDTSGELTGEDAADGSAGDDASGEVSGDGIADESMADDTADRSSKDDESGAVLGTLVYSYEGREVGRADIYASGSTVSEYAFGVPIEGTGAAKASSDAEGRLGGGERSRAGRVIRIVIIIAVIAAAAVLCLFFYINRSVFYRKISRSRGKKYKTIKPNRKWKRRR